MADQDLITYARDAASRGDDLFALLATDATASESDIRRAFRRKALTAHPDKAGDAYDPALYERLERARDVLLTPEAREAYDNGMRAVLQKKVQLEQMTQKRRQMVEELERREEEAKRAKTDAGPRTYDAERAAMAARGRAKMDEMRRMKEAAEVRERLAREKEASAAAAKGTSADKQSAAAAAASQDGQPTPPPTNNDYDEQIAELERRLKEKKLRKAEKEQRKAEKKAGKFGTPPAPGSPGGKTSNNPPPPPTAAEPQADEDKVSALADAAPSAAPPPVDNQPKAGDRFASTMARLRAAQAKRDEEKRRKAEEEARAAAGVAAP
jgi:DnaJ family protein C protein 17